MRVADDNKILPNEENFLPFDMSATNELITGFASLWLEDVSSI